MVLSALEQYLNDLGHRCHRDPIRGFDQETETVIVYIGRQSWHLELHGDQLTYWIWIPADLVAYKLCRGTLDLTAPDFVDRLRQVLGI